MKRILIIEDEPGITASLQIFMSSEIDATYAIDFAEAQKCLGQDSFDLVLTDFNFPGGNGDDVAELAHDRGIPVMLHSGDCTQAKSPFYTRLFEKLSPSLMTALMTGRI